MKHWTYTRHKFTFENKKLGSCILKGKWANYATQFWKELFNDCQYDIQKYWKLKLSIEFQFENFNTQNIELIRNTDILETSQIL